jgi:hypothetical protein
MIGALSKAAFRGLHTFRDQLVSAQAELSQQLAAIEGLLALNGEQVNGAKKRRGWPPGTKNKPKDLAPASAPEPRSYKCPFDDYTREGTNLRCIVAHMNTHGARGKRWLHEQTTSKPKSLPTAITCAFCTRSVANGRSLVQHVRHAHAAKYPNWYKAYKDAKTKRTG